MAEEDFERFKHEIHDLFVNFRRGRHTLRSSGDLTTGESGVLITIARMRGAAPHTSGRMVAHMANMTPSALLADASNRLRRRAMSSASASARIRAALTWQLTEKGLELAKQGERMRDDYLRELFSYLGDDDVADLIRVVRRMNEFFETKRSDADQGGEGGRACASRDGEDGPACA